MDELIDHNEPGAAVEMITAILAEVDAEIAADQVGQIGSLVRDMGLDYPNGDGQEVRWILAAVETLDELGDDISDGREVYSEPLGPGEGIVPHLEPERSTPTQSGV